MTDYTAMCLVKAFAINAEVEGMKVFNAQRIEAGMSPGYDQTAFDQKSLQLEELARDILRNMP